MHPDAADAGLTVVGTRLGTSYTMAPEQIRGDAVDQRTDIYSMGIVLYQMLTGQRPYEGSVATIARNSALTADGSSGFVARRGSGQKKPSVL